MKLHLKTKLEYDDKTLFTQSACHVFANELATNLRSKGFVLSRLADLNGTNPPMQALHVFLSRQGVLVDVEGVQDVADYLESSRWYRHDNDGPIPNFQILDCSQDELFRPTLWPGDQERGARNKWLHCIDPDFVSECRHRAQARLAATPELYGIC